MSIETKSRTVLGVKNSLLKRSVSLAAIGATAMLGSAPAFGLQDSDNTQQDSDNAQNADIVLEEIVVTSRRRAESAQDVPLTVNVFSGNSLREKGITNFELVEENTPGFTLDILGGTRARPTIRGIGSDETGPGGDPSTGVFVDGVYQGRSGAQAVEAFDLERVEVLKGPQGTLFGRNVVGGAVSFITTKPQDENSARIALTYGNFDTFETQGHLNIAASEQLKLRVAFTTKNNSGFGVNNFTGNRNSDINRQSARVHALYEPNDTLSFLLTADFTNDDASGRTGNTHRLNGEDDVDVDGPFENNAEIDGFSERELWGISLTSEIDFGNTTLTNITAYKSIEEGFLDDIDGFNRLENPDLVNVDLGFTDDAETFSTETRLNGAVGRLNWTTGLYYSREDGDGTVTLRIDGTGAENVSEAFDTDLFFTGSGTTDSIAVFGEATYELTDRLNLTGGLRYTSDTKDFTGSFFAAGGAVEVRTESIEGVSFDEITWRVALDYELTENMLVFGTVSTGFKSGAFPLIATAPSQFITPLAPETATNYEIGLKADLFDRRLRANVSVFSQDFENLQIISVSSAGDNDSINAPRADIDGFEIDLTALLTDSLSVEARYAYLDATYRPFLFGGQVLEGAQVIRTPESDFSFSARYEYHFNTGGLFYLSPQVSYRSQIFDDVDNNLEELRPARTIANIFAGYVSSSEEWELRAFVRNLTNENYFNRVSNIPGIAGQSTSGPPRTYGIQLVYNF